MNREMESLLTDCLDQLDQGVSIDVILSRYPEHAADLRPYLHTAVQISQLASRPTIAAQQKSQALFLSQAAALRAPQLRPIPFWLTLRRLLLPVASLALILLLVGAGLAARSTAAIPGDNLYSLKRFIEDGRLSLAKDPEQILSLSAQFKQERLNEIALLLSTGREADVLFEGAIEVLNNNNWVVSGLTVEITDETNIDGTPRIGEIARIDGRTAAGSLLARQISVITGRPDPEETILPTVIPTLKPQEPQQATPVPPTAKSAATPVSSPSPILPTDSDSQNAPVVTSTPTPAAQPQPTADVDTGNGGESGDNSNDNSGDNNNDNSEDNNNDNSEDNNNDNSEDNNNDNSEDNSNNNSGDNNNNNSEDDNKDKSEDNGNDNSEDNNNDNSEDNNNDNFEDNNNDNSEDNGNDNSEDNNNDNSEDNGNDNSEDNNNDNKDNSEDANFRSTGAKIGFRS